MNKRSIAGELHWPLILTVFAIAGLGLTNLYSASAASASSVYVAQMYWLALGVAVAATLAFIDYRVLEWLAIPFYLLVCGLLILVMAKGVYGGGARRWLSLGFARFQPSELAKIAVVLVLARWVSSTDRRGSLTLGELLRPWNLSRPLGLSGLLFALWDKPVLRGILHSNELDVPLALAEQSLFEAWWIRVLLVLVATVWTIVALVVFFGARGQDRLRAQVAPIDLLLVPVGLIAVQPDLGTGMLVGIVGFSLFLFIGIHWRSLAALVVLGAAVAGAAWRWLLHDYQRQRIVTFMDPGADARGAGWHSLQSMIAVGSGQMHGKGWMQGTQTQLSFLPEQHTDFVFSVWAEERGFMGCALLIGLYFVLVVCGISIAEKARDRFGTLLAVGVTAVVFWHVFVNIGMVIGVMPVVGVTLPLLSYGGTSMLTVMICVGLLLNVHMRRFVF